MKDPLGVSPSKGTQGATHDFRIRCTVTLPTELRGWTEKVEDDLGGGEEKVRVHMNVMPRNTMNTNGGTKNYGCVFHGLHITL